MPLIAFEGIDRSGKETQAKLLKDWFGDKAELVSFPRYNGPVGALIKANIRCHKTVQGAAYLQTLMVADRLDFVSGLSQDLSHFTIVDRFTMTGVAYGMADGLPYDWCMDLHRPLPSLDLTFLVDIPAHIAAARRPAEDGYEANLMFQRQVAENYLNLALALPNVYVLDGTETPEAIHQEVLQVVTAYYPDAGRLLKSA